MSTVRPGSAGGYQISSPDGLMVAWMFTPCRLALTEYLRSPSPSRSRSATAPSTRMYSVWLAAGRGWETGPCPPAVRHAVYIGVSGGFTDAEAGSDLGQGGVLTHVARNGRMGAASWKGDGQEEVRLSPASSSATSVPVGAVAAATGTDSSWSHRIILPVAVWRVRGRPPHRFPKPAVDGGPRQAWAVSGSGRAGSSRVSTRGAVCSTGRRWVWLSSRRVTSGRE